MASKRNEKMSETLNENKKTVLELRRELPEFMSGWNEFTKKFHQEGALTKRERELIAVALSAAKQCHWCVGHHVKGALDAGANRKEILEAAFENVLMSGGPGFVHMRMVLDALDELD